MFCPKRGTLLAEENDCAVVDLDWLYLHARREQTASAGDAKRNAQSHPRTCCALRPRDVGEARPCGHREIELLLPVPG